MAITSGNKRKQSSYDAGFKLHVKNVENWNNYAARHEHAAGTSSQKSAKS